MKDRKLAKRPEAQKVDGKEGRESRNCDERTALGDAGKELEKNGE